MFRFHHFNRYFYSEVFLEFWRKELTEVSEAFSTVLERPVLVVSCASGYETTRDREMTAVGMVDRQ